MTTVVVTGSIDRIDRLPSGGNEVIDDKIAASLQLSIYALACRDALRLGTPERATLSFAELVLPLSTTRTDEQLDAARMDGLARVSRMRAGEFAATPGEACRWWRLRSNVSGESMSSRAGPSDGLRLVRPWLGDGQVRPAMVTTYSIDYALVSEYALLESSSAVAAWPHGCCGARPSARRSSGGLQSRDAGPRRLLISHAN